MSVLGFGFGCIGRGPASTAGAEAACVTSAYSAADSDRSYYRIGNGFVGLRRNNGQNSRQRGG